MHASKHHRPTRTEAHDRSVASKIRDCAERRARLERLALAIADVLEGEANLHAALESVHSSDGDIARAERAVRDLAFAAEMVQRQGLSIEIAEVRAGGVLRA